MTETNLMKNKQGIILVAIVVTISIVVCAMLWLVTAYPVALYWDAISVGQDLRVYAMIDLLHNISGWMIIVLIGGLFLYLAVCAFRKEVIDYPIR